MPGLGPELCHNRGLALPRPWDCVDQCDSHGGTGSLRVLCYRFGPGTVIRQVYESIPVVTDGIIPINRHQSSISSLESYRTSKYPQLLFHVTQACDMPVAHSDIQVCQPE